MGAAGYRFADVHRPGAHRESAEVGGRLLGRRTSGGTATRAELALDAFDRNCSMCLAAHAALGDLVLFVDI